MSVSVSKSPPVVVRPSETTGGNLNLSSYDKNHMCIPVTMFLVFDNPINEPAETIRSALSQALADYPAISGRLAVENNDVHVTFGGAYHGVPFVAAAASCALKDADFSDRSSRATSALLDELAGFVELMMGLKPMDDVAILDITVPSRLIDSTKDAFRRRRSKSKYGGPPCTTFEAVAAVLWRCRTRAILSSSADTSENPVVALYFTVNARRYAGAREGYYGNCLTGRLVVSTRAAVGSGDLAGVVGMIRRAKEHIPEQFDHAATGNDDVQQQVNVGGLVGYNVLIVTCWRNLGVDEADFGGGTPARVTSHTRQEVAAPACVACLPVRGSDGANVLSGCVRKEHAGAFLAELALSSSAT